MDYYLYGLYTSSEPGLAYLLVLLDYNFLDAKLDAHWIYMELWAVADWILLGWKPVKHPTILERDSSMFSLLLYLYYM